MHRHARHLFTVLLALAACKRPGPHQESPSEIYAEACAEILTCGCTDDPYNEEESCIESLAGRYDFTAEEAAKAGLTMDWGCVEVELRITRPGCDGSPPPAQQSQCANCAVAYGDRQVGEPCEQFWTGDITTTGFSDCAQGLACSDGENSTCYDPCAPPEAGSPCPWGGCGDDLVCGFDGLCRSPIAAEGEYCNWEIGCEEGLVCGHMDAGSGTCGEPLPEGGSCTDCVGCCGAGFGCTYDTGVCAPIAGLGASCAAIECVAGAYCDSNFTCQPTPGAGEPCESACQPGLVCTDSICGPPPGEGEPCPDFECADGLICGDDLVCHAPPPEACRLD